MGTWNLLAFEGLVKPYVNAIDGTRLKSKGHVGHMHHPKVKELYLAWDSGNDTVSRWGFSHPNKGWILGY